MNSSFRRWMTASSSRYELVFAFAMKISSVRFGVVSWNESGWSSTILFMYGAWRLIKVKVTVSHCLQAADIEGGFRAVIYQIKRFSMQRSVKERRGRPLDSRHGVFADQGCRSKKSVRRDRWLRHRMTGYFHTRDLFPLSLLSPSESDSKLSWVWSTSSKT